MVPDPAPREPLSGEVEEGPFRGLLASLGPAPLLPPPPPPALISTEGLPVPLRLESIAARRAGLWDSLSWPVGGSGFTVQKAPGTLITALLSSSAPPGVALCQAHTAILFTKSQVLQRNSLYILESQCICSITKSQILKNCK